MATDSMLYPITNQARSAMALDGFWKFAIDPEGIGEKEGWNKRLETETKVPVPASFSDLFTDAKIRDFCGDFWYEKDIFIPDDQDDREFRLRFGSVTHRCTVFFNGTKVVDHEGGFLPFSCNVSTYVKKGTLNRITVKGNNELNETCIPCGATAVLSSGRKIAKPYFDFFNYSGINRPVWLQRLPKETTEDFDLSYQVQGSHAQIQYQVITNGDSQVKVSLLDKEQKTVAQSIGKKGTMRVENPRLWEVRNAYLYTFCVQIMNDDDIIDEYTTHIGIRTVKISGNRILLNDKPVYLKGFGKHEDFEICGRGLNLPVIKRDFECMKWIGANCFRTSHYPYAEEWYQFADEEGFLIIDEVPAVGMMRSTKNFAVAGTGKYTSFFESPTIGQLLRNHKDQVRDMIQRDKHHPSVISFSLFNEPETVSSYAHDYFADLFSYARGLDPERRPLTGAFEKNSKPELCKVYRLCDFICLNRYYGWYISGGPEIEEAERQMRDELDRWKAKNIGVPFVFTELGTDTLASEHKLPSIMWSQEYQTEYYEMNFRVISEYDFIQGELVWNYSDFQTSEGILRVNGNKKGIFTRTRQPKEAAHFLRKRWLSL